MNTENKISIKGMRIRTLNLLMISISCLLYILLIVASFRALDRYQSMISDTNDYITYEKDALLLAEGSNYLTEQARLFTVTTDIRHADNYFTEIHTTKRRRKTLKQLESEGNVHKNYNLLKTALEDSYELVEREVYSIKLVALAKGYDMTAYEEIEQAELSDEDLSLSPEEMIEKAHQNIFGTDYQEFKKQIMDNISAFMDAIIDETRQKQQNSASRLKMSISGQQILISILFIENILIFVLIIRLIIKPLQIYVKNIRDEKRLEITGSYEFKYLALTYNNIFEINAANETMLRHQAEHDPLTGIMNRGAFDQLKEIFRVKLEPLALLIIDVDKFKLVNDGYGHEMGDKVLKKVAELLEESFRSTDFPARIGGDEFAVILTNVTPELKSMIENKINILNEKLMHPDDGLPEISLSVGAAFSECGFSGNLYKQADIALYHVKEHGRCGCSFYEGEDDV